MQRWGRRLGYLLLFLFWLTVMSLPLFSVVLAVRGQIRLGSEESWELRVFLLQLPDAEGVGVEWSRPLRSQPGCRQTTVTYFMWRGQGENVRFTNCLPASGLIRVGDDLAR